MFVYINLWHYRLFNNLEDALGKGESTEVSIINDLLAKDTKGDLRVYALGRITSIYDTIYNRSFIKSIPLITPLLTNTPVGGKSNARFS